MRKYVGSLPSVQTQNDRVKSHRLFFVLFLFFSVSCAQNSNIKIYESEEPPEIEELEEGDGPAPTYTISLPDTKRQVWVADEVYPRTIAFTHDATGVSCSKDGGLTYVPCSNPNSHVWKAKNYEVEHRIRFYRPGSRFAIYSFKPSELFPNHKFVNCDANLSGNMSFETFQENMNRESGRTLCLQNATYIQNTGAESAITVTKDNITIITRHGYGAYFKSLGISSIFDLGSTQGFTLVGTDLEINYNSNDRFAIKGNGGDSLLIDSLTIENKGTTGNDGAKLILIASGYSSGKLKINNATLAAGSGVALEIQSAGSVAEIEDSTLTGKKGALFTAGSVSVRSSVLGSNGTVAGCHSVRINGATVEMNNSKIYDSSGYGAIYFGASSGTLNMNSSIVRRTFSNSSASSTVFVDGTGTPHSVNGTDNIFCNEGVSPQFTGVASTGFITGTAITGAVLYACPADTEL